MPTFTDIAGRDWRITLTVDTVAHIRRETGVNLNDVFARDRDGQTPITRLAGDPEALVGVLFAACEKQIAELGLSPRDFSARFDGDALESATTALLEALCDYFPTRLREPMHRARRKIEGRIQEVQITDAELDRLIDRAMSRPPETSTAPLPASPGSSA